MENEEEDDELEAISPGLIANKEEEKKEEEELPKELPALDDLL